MPPQWDILQHLTTYDGYCIFGSLGIAILACGRYLLHRMENHVLALRITQITWTLFVVSIPVTGLFWVPLTLSDTTQDWTLDIWVHDIGSWSTVLVIGYATLGMVHGSLCLPLPALVLGSCATIYSGGGASLLHDAMAGQEIRDAIGISSWLFAYLAGIFVSRRVVVPVVRHFIATEEQAEALRCSK